RIFSAPPCSLKNAAFMVSSSERHLGALVLHAPGLVVPARERAGFGDLRADSQPQPRAQALAEPRPARRAPRGPARVTARRARGCRPGPRGGRKTIWNSSTSP